LPLSLFQEEVLIQMELLRGKPVREALLKEIKANLEDLAMQPQLAIVRVDGDKPSASYAKMATKTMESVGIDVKSVIFSPDVTLTDLQATAAELNEDPSVHGIIFMQPFPNNIQREDIAELIDPRKDVDCLNPVNLGKVMANSEDAMYPSTAKAVLELIDHYGIELKGTEVCVVGSSLVVGSPLVQMLINREATVANCHIETKDITVHTAAADLLISATGALEMIKADHVKEGATVIDVGFGMKNGNPTGDVDFKSVKDIVGNVTPVPGGVGSITTAVLAQQVVKAVQLLARDTDAK